MTYEITLVGGLGARNLVWARIGGLYTGWVPNGPSTTIYAKAEKLPEMIALFVETGVEFTLKAEKR